MAVLVSRGWSRLFTHFTSSGHLLKNLKGNERQKRSQTARVNRDVSERNRTTDEGDFHIAQYVARSLGALLTSSPRYSKCESAALRPQDEGTGPAGTPPALAPLLYS